MAEHNRTYERGNVQANTLKGAVAGGVAAWIMAVPVPFRHPAPWRTVGAQPQR
jgi:hypothetical protein